MRCNKEFMKAVNLSTQMIKEGKITIKDIYQHMMTYFPNNVAIMSHNKDDSVSSFTYTEYKLETINAAKRLNNFTKNLKHNDIIALKLANSPYWLFYFWAILMCGFRPLLLDAKLAKDNTNNVLKNGNVKAIIFDTDNKYENVINITLKQLNESKEDDSFKLNWADEVIFCSSGTTGDIKLMVFDGKNLIYQINTCIKIPPQNRDICYLTTKHLLRNIVLLPLHHIFAFVAIFLWFTYYGATLFFISSNEPTVIINDIKRFKITHIFHVPLFFEIVSKKFRQAVNEKNKKAVQKLLDHNLGIKDGGPLVKIIQNKVQKKVLGPQIRFLISGGGFLNKETADTINGLGYCLYNGFGMTEVGVTSVELSPNVFLRNKRSVGKPLYHVHYKLGLNNELLIKSPTIHVKEIINGVEQKTKLDSQGYFATGDVADFDIDNRYYIKGRIKDVIITSNGENVYPDELESYFKDIPGVKSIAIFSSHNSIILIASTLNANYDDFININKKLPLHKQANNIILIKDILPLSSSMKVKRYLVKEMYEKGVFSKGREVNNKKKREIISQEDKLIVATLEKIFKKVLYSNEDIKIDAHWINDLHSDSMSYITLISEIEKEYHVSFQPENFGCLTCIGDFLDEIKRQKH